LIGRGCPRRERSTAARAAVLVVLAAFLVLSVAATSGADSDGTGGMPAAASPSGAAAYARAADVADQQRAYRDSAAGRAERAQSRAAFRGQSPSEALATARAKFSGLVERPALKWPPLGQGEQLDRYVGERSAVVSDANGRRGLLESTLPLTGTTPDGADAPIDLSLTDAGGAYLEPRSAPQPARVPKSSAGKVRLAGGDIGVGLADAASRDVAMTAGKAFFGNALTDTDLLIEATPLGAEVSLLLRSPQSPSSPALSFDLPAGARLQLVDATSSGSAPPGAAEIVRGGDRIALIDPAVAIDAQGASVPVSYRVADDRLVMQIDTSGDVAWPVAVDPTVGVFDNNGQNVYGTSGACPSGQQVPCWANWHPQSNRTMGYCVPGSALSFYLCPSSNALYVYGFNTTGSGWTNPDYNGGDWARFYKNARANSYIYKFIAGNMSHAASNSKIFAGVCKSSCSAWSAGYWYDALRDQYSPSDYGYAVNFYPSSEMGDTEYFCVRVAWKAPCTNPDVPGLADDNTAVFGISMNAGTPAAQPSVAMGGASTYSSEQHDPTVSVASRTNPDWVDTNSYNDTVNLSANDVGLGFGKLSVTSPSGTQTRSAPCTTTNSYDSCSLTWPNPNRTDLPSASFSYAFGSSTTPAPEGITNISATATDVVGNTGATTWQAKVDRTPPVMSLSGSLYDARGTTLADGTYDLNILALDGWPGDTTARSGVKSIEVLVDGDQEAYWEQACPQSSCGMQQTFHFTNQDWPAEDETITVVATDFLGHQTTSDPIHVTPSGNPPDDGVDEPDFTAADITDQDNTNATVAPPQPLESPTFAADKAAANAEADAATPSGAAVEGEDLADADAVEENIFYDDIGATSAAPTNPTTSKTRVGLKREGIAASDTQDDRYVDPSDSTGAISRTYYVEATNRRIGIYRVVRSATNPDLTPVDSMPLSSFIRHLGDSVTDPQIQWDASSQRWLFAGQYYKTTSGTTKYRLVYGWSQSADPAFSNWCALHFTSATTTQHDFPKLGHDKNHLIVGVNEYDGGTDPKGSRVFVASKPRGNESGCPTPKAHRFFPKTGYLKTVDDDGNGDKRQAWTPVPANTLESPAVGYIVASANDEYYTTTNKIGVWYVSGPASQPRLTRDDNINVPAYQLAPDAPQPDPGQKLWVHEPRLTQAVAATDPDVGKLMIWTQHTIRGAEKRAVVRWYEIQPPRAAADPRVPRQSGTIQSSQHYVFNGAISPAANGRDAAINYNVGSHTLAVRIRARARSGSAPLGTMAPEVTLARSTNADQSATCQFPNIPCYWGDYGGASPDPMNASNVWGTNSYVKPKLGSTCNFPRDGHDHVGPCPHWGTYNFALRAPAP
jgi:hypothetical protein